MERAAMPNAISPDSPSRTTRLPVAEGKLPVDNEENAGVTTASRKLRNFTLRALKNDWRGTRVVRVRVHACYENETKFFIDLSFTCSCTYTKENRYTFMEYIRKSLFLGENGGMWRT